LSDPYSELAWRGLIQDATRDTEAFLKETEAPAGYIGFDPTAASLHIGSLVQIMTLVHFQRAGGRPIAVLGGGTGMIGDPSGRSSERQFLSMADLERNVQGIRAQFERFLDFSGPRGAVLVNNLDWLAEVKFLDFLRGVGKFYTVNQMLAKESVKLRLDRAREGAEGISYTEFSYMLMQAYDFLQLFDSRGCRLQMGGSDQWGNITAGIELIGRLRDRQAFGLVTPLVTRSDGQKFGKSEGGNIWLDAELTSPYRFYQYWINVGDDDVERYLKFFTLLSADEIRQIVAAHAAEPHRRSGQSELALRLTRLVHGEDGCRRATAATRALFGGDLEELEPADLADVFADVPSIDLATVEAARDPFTAVELALWSGMTASKGEARRLIEGGGVFINNRKVENFSAPIERAMRLHDRFLVLRKGKKSYWLVTWAD
jgi:tyrosyl-tRNA synthetase